MNGEHSLQILTVPKAFWVLVFRAHVLTPVLLNTSYNPRLVTWQLYLPVVRS